MKRKTPFQYTLFLVFVILLSKRSFAQAELQPKTPEWLNTPITLNGKSITFADGIAALAAQTKHLILVDGTPIAAATDWELHDSAKSVLDTFCARYDYDWTVNSRGAILMQKRFFDPNDLPQMHLAEMRQMSSRHSCCTHHPSFRT